MLPSADDAAEDLAYNVGHGSVGRFIGMMNARARELGLRHTHYSTPSGLDTPGNYSTAADLVKLASLRPHPFAVFRPHRRAAPRRPAFRRTTSATWSTATPSSGGYPWINGVKTGHTAAAGYVLVAAGHRDGMTLLSAVLGTASEAVARRQHAGAAGLRVCQLPPGLPGPRRRRCWPARRCATAPASTLPWSRRRASRGSWPRRAGVAGARGGSAPAHRSPAPPRRLGTAVVLVDGRPVARIPLVLAQALPAVSSLTIAAQFMTRPRDAGRCWLPRRESHSR